MHVQRGGEQSGRGVAEGATVGNRQVNDDLPQMWDTSTDLATLGIRLCEPMGEVVAEGSWIIIGTLIATGNLIDAVPRTGLMETQFARLLAAAMQVWMFGRGSLENWQYRPGEGWMVEVTMRQPADGFRLDMESICSDDGDLPLVLAGFSLPLAR